MHDTNQDLLAKDVLRGADQIAAYVFGDPMKRRFVYHMVESQKLPVFRLGGIICARKSVLLAWIEKQEQQAVGVSA